MKRRVLFVFVALAVIILAVGGWTVEGARWMVTGSRRRLQPA
jgi:hypothetical protein